ncbi:MAG TPA: redoxin domain-containing protein, partial [Syntrophales bacterium]|nr:redoxin domain-containing protein [Syntrophales bacterium]
FIVAMTLLLIINPLSAADSPPVAGGILPDIKLSIPKDSAGKSYLGLGFFGFGSFRIPEIKTRLVIIEIFSMYCPYCQREAPNVNKLYDKIEQDPYLKGKIKIIGIGAGNTSYEVDTFKRKYNILFPLFPDEDYAIHKMVGEVRTPYFIGVKVNPDGSHQVIYSKLGGFEGVDQFLEMIVKLSGLQ